MLEQLIADNTAALHELIRTLKGATAAPLVVPATPIPADNLRPSFITIADLDPFAGKSMSAPTLTATPAPEAAAKPAGRPRKAIEPVPTVAASAPAAEPVKAAAEPVKAAAEPVTYEQTAAALMALVKRHGRDAAVTTLAVFGVKLLPDLKPTPEKFAEFIAACEAQV